MNLFSISTLILSLSGIVFSLIIFRSNRENKVNKAWFYSCIMFSTWALGLSGVTLSKTYSVALFWQYILDVSAIFLPFFYLVFVIRLLNLNLSYLQKVFFSIAVLYSLFSFTIYFKKGLVVIYDFFWVNPGNYYYTFLLYFIFYALFSFVLLIWGYNRAEKNSILRYQIRNTIFGAIMGYGGGVTNFFPQLFSIYPYGNYLVILYIVFMIYGVLKYKMMSTKVVSAQVFSTALVLISLFNLLKTSESGDWIVNFAIFILMIIFSLFLIRSVNQEVRVKEALMIANAEQENLIHIISHQIKGYLAKGRNIFAELLTEPAYGPIPDSARPMLYGGLKSLTEGVKFTEQILNTANVEKGKMMYSKDEFDLKDVVSKNFESYKELALKKGLQFDISVAQGSYVINGDPIQISEVIRNLIDNSFNYTPTGYIIIKLERSLDKIWFTIQDSGVGIAPEDMKKLFTKGGRGKDSLKINVNSTGYGLFFVKKVIDAHSGSIKVESAGRNKGTKLTVEFIPVDRH